MTKLLPSNSSWSRVQNILQCSTLEFHFNTCARPAASSKIMYGSAGCWILDIMPHGIDGMLNLYTAVNELIKSKLLN